MKSLKSLNLKNNEVQAIIELKKRVLRLYPDAELILFGSKARGDYNKNSDVDILILLGTEVNSKVEKNIISNISDIYSTFDDVVFETLIKNRNDWNYYKGNPFLKENIDREGVRL